MRSQTPAWSAAHVVVATGRGTRQGRRALHRKHHARATLKALAGHDEIDGCIPARACKGDEALAKFNKAGIHIEDLGDRLQVEGAASFVKSWNELLQCIASKSDALKAA